jgi:hypothetical protein
MDEDAMVGPESEEEKRPGLLPGWLRIPPGLLMILVVMSGAVAFAIVALVVRDNVPTGQEAYFANIEALSADAARDLAAVAPSEVLASCLAGTSSACAEQEENATAAAERVAQLSNAIGSNTPPFEAVIWHSSYLDVLGDLRLSLLAQTNAIANSDMAALERAVAQTRAAVEEEASLTDQFNADFVDRLQTP